MESTADEYEIEMAFAHVSEKEAREGEPQLISELSKPPLFDPAIRWNNDSERLHVKVSFVSDDDIDHNKVVHLITSRVGEALHPGSPRVQLSETEVFTFDWNEQQHVWECEIELDEEYEFDMCFLCSGGRKDPVHTDRGVEVLRNIKTLDERYRTAAADDMLDTYNNSWNENEKIDAAEFESQLGLSRIDVHSNGCVGFWYSTETEMFCDHDLLVYTDSDGRVSSVSVEG